MNFKSTVLAVTLGVLLAGIIMLLASLGVFGAISSIISGLSSGAEVIVMPM